VIAWDYSTNAAAYDPTTNRWRQLPRVPVDEAECYPRSVALDGPVAIFGEFCGALVRFDAGRDAWQRVRRPDGADRTDQWLELVAAGNAALVLGRDLETSREEVLAYRP
jgi:hypothetical protein